MRNKNSTQELFEIANRTSEIESARLSVAKVMCVDIHSTNRKRKVVEGRMVYAKLLREIGYPYSEIGETIRKDHTTIIHYVKSIASLIKNDEDFANKVENCKRLFYDGREIPIEITKEAISAELLNVKYKLQQVTLENSKLLKFSRYERLMDIIKIIDAKTPEGQEAYVQNKIERLFNNMTYNGKKQMWNRSSEFY